MEAGHQQAGDQIEHEEETRAVIDDQLEDASSQGAVTNIAAITGGESPTEAEFNALVTRVNVLTQVLRDAGLIPSA
jgi:hypothetical protein